MDSNTRIDFHVYLFIYYTDKALVGKLQCESVQAVKKER